MTSERMGVVILELPGRTIPLRFTWQAIDVLGRTGVSDIFARAKSGEPGDVGALADLIVVASAGAVTRDELMAEPPSISAGLAAVLEAWLLAMHGPARQLAEGQEPGDLPTSRPTWWKRAFGRRSPQA